MSAVLSAPTYAASLDSCRDQWNKLLAANPVGTRHLYQGTETQTFGTEVRTTKAIEEYTVTQKTADALTFSRAFQTSALPGKVTNWSQVQFGSQFTFDCTLDRPYVFGNELVMTTEFLDPPESKILVLESVDVRVLGLPVATTHLKVRHTQDLTVEDIDTWIDGNAMLVKSQVETNFANGTSIRITTTDRLY